MLYLLRSMDRTEQQLRQKLKEGDYPEEIIDIAIAYVQKLHYQDDRRYASNYVDYRKKNKSRLQLKQGAVLQRDPGGYDEGGSGRICTG